MTPTTNKKSDTSTGSLDTSGRVAGDTDGLAVWFEFDDLTPFEQGYIEAMFAELCARRDIREYLDLHDAADPTFSDLAPATLAQIREDCGRDMAAGQRLNFAGNTEDRTSASAGRKFWLERQTGNLFDAPKLRLYLNEAGQVCTAPEADGGRG